MSREPALRCYVCNRPALPGDVQCRACGLTLDWGAISDLRSLDYLKLRVEQWRRRGDLDDELAARLAAEAEGNRKTLLKVLAEGGPHARPEPRPARTPEPPPFVPPPVRRLRPRYEIGPAVPVGVVERPAPRRRTEGEPPPFTMPPPRPPRPPRRPVLDVLADFGTLRLILYTGALLFAVGTVVWLRETLRVQLQRPVVQASLLGLVTFAALAGGVALVARARDRAEQRLIGRGVLFLGTLLLPLNPWFWLRTGLIEDRGNAWIVTLLTCAVSLAIAFGLGDRVFVYMAYAAALATGWLVTFKVTGGAAPGAYALVLALVSGAFLHAELPVEQAAERRGWEKLGPAFFLCGHLGVAITLVFYTSVVRFIPPELFAAFRHFDASGYTPWIGVAVSLLAAEAFFYSAWRRADARYTYVGAAAAGWAVALSLWAWDAAPGVWLAACGGAALIAGLVGRALADAPVWGSPLTRVSRVFAWTGLAAAAVVAVAFANGVELRWFTALGAALLFATFALETAETRRGVDAVPLAPLALLVVAWALHAAGAPWVYADAVLAALVAAAPFAAALFRPGWEGARDGVRYSAAAMCWLLALPAIDYAVRAAPERAHRPVPFAVALALAFAANAWAADLRGLRVALFAAAGGFVETAALLATAVVEFRLGVNDRFAAFLLAPAAYALLGGWLVLRRSDDARRADAAAVLRVWASVAVGVAVYRAFPLLVDGALDWRGGFVFALALALVAVVPIAVAAVERDEPAAHVEGTYGVMLALGSWFGLVAGVGQWMPIEDRALAVAVMAGLAPLALAAVERFGMGAAPAVARPAGVVGGGLALLLAVALAPVLDPAFAENFVPRQRAAFVALAILLAVYGLRGAAVYAQPWGAMWAAHATAVTALGAHAVIRSVPDPALAALGFAVAGGLALAAGSRAVRDARPLAPAAIAIGHALVVVALADAAAVQVVGRPVSWKFVGVVVAAACAYAAAAAAAERGSALDRAHRALAVVASLASVSAALHAAGLTTVVAQATPLAAALTLAMAACVATRSGWAREDGRRLLHALMVALLVVVAGTAPAEGPWAARDVAMLALVVAVFYAVAAAVRSAASLAASVASASVSLLAAFEHYGVAWPTRATVFAALGAALAVASSRFGERAAWAQPTVERSGHVVFVLALVGELVLVVPEIALGNVALGPHVAAFGTLTAGAFVVRRALGERAEVYGAGWRALAFVTYCLVGVRLGYHPWRDSAYYTLPVGVVLVGLGAWASRRDASAEPGVLLWLGSLLTAAPLLLHALDNRFVQEVSSVNYDVATLAAGLALALFGLLVQLRAPSAVGAAAVGVDLFVVAFSRIEWNQQTIAAFIAVVGALMILGVWFVAYRRDDLYRLRDAFAAFRRWR